MPHVRVGVGLAWTPVLTRLQQSGTRGDANHGETTVISHGMTSTTIKVCAETRDRLKAQAAAAHLTLGEHLTRLVDEADRRSRLARLRQSVAEMSGESTRTHAVEAAGWETTELDDARGLGG